MTSLSSTVENSCSGVPDTCIVNLPVPHTKLEGSPIARGVAVGQNRGQTLEEIVQDGKEDRTKSLYESTRRNHFDNMTHSSCRVKAEGVIVVSSEEEVEGEEGVKVNLDLESTVQPALPVHRSSSDSGCSGSKTPTRWKLTTPKTRKRFPAARRIIESSESEDSVPELSLQLAKKQPTRKVLTDEIIELTSSSEDEGGHSTYQRPRTSHEKAALESFPSYLTQEDDGAILIFDEPKSARKPVRVAVPPKGFPFEQSQDVTTFLDADRPTSSLLLESPTLLDDASPSGNINTPVGRQNTRPKLVKTTTRVSKKVIEEAEQARRESYGQELFDELNKSVFRNGLPENTKLNWNKRLLTTAGKAKYRRSRDGVETSEIELATKILDCDERIRNTLSHEMCHLATWVIDRKLDENHGKLFKYWASKVTKRRPDIEITTRHSYEISYPYKWECQKCQKIYGRYSKSIRPDECVCGACREGRLVPLFTVRNRTQTPKVSRLAAEKSQVSPCSLSNMNASKVRVDDIDSEIGALTAAVAKTSLF